MLEKTPAHNAEIPRGRAGGTVGARRDASGCHSRPLYNFRYWPVRAIQAVAPALGVELTPIDARDANEIEHTIAGSATGGVIVTASPSAFRGRDLIIALAARHRLPAVYPTPRWAADGGLISYGPDEIDQHRRAVCYAGGRYATAGASLSSH